MTLEELLKAIPETEYLYVTCGENGKNEYLGYRHHFLSGNVFLDKKVKTIQLCWFDDDKAYLHVRVAE